MSVNVGTVDRVLRALIGLGLLILAFGGVSDLFAPVRRNGSPPPWA